MILQSHIPYDVTNERPLPGVAPLEPGKWLLQDDAFSAQMAERARLIREHRADVIATLPESDMAVKELFKTALSLLATCGYQVTPEVVLRPDGEKVFIDHRDLLGTLGQLVQEDLCVLQKVGGEHLLTAAVLCFPASWRLAEKIGCPLSVIHAPVDSYDADITRRVQRLFDGIHPDRPLWRFNVLHYDDPTLFQPRSEKTPRPLGDPGRHEFIRSERQCLFRLPETRAVVFSIHTFVTRVSG